MIKSIIDKSLEAVHTHTHTHTDSLNKRTILLNMPKINKDSKYNPGDDSG